MDLFERKPTKEEKKAAAALKKAERDALQFDKTVTVDSPRDYMV